MIDYIPRAEAQMVDAPMIVKVKPLAWQEAYDSHPWGWKAWCDIMGGFYYADNLIEKQEQDELRAARILAALDLTPDPRVTALVEAAEALDRAVSEVTRYGAQTGSQWTRLSIASLKFRAAFKGVSNGSE